MGVREGGRQGYFLGRDTENFLEKCYGLWEHQATPCRAHRASSIHTHLLQGAQECKLLKRSNHVLPAFRALPATVPDTERDTELVPWSSAGRRQSDLGEGKQLVGSGRKSKVGG